MALFSQPTARALAILDLLMANPHQAFGLTVTALLPLVEGVPVVCHPDPADAINVARAIARHKATVYFGSSTCLSRLKWR